MLTRDKNYGLLGSPLTGAIIFNFGVRGDIANVITPVKFSPISSDIPILSFQLTCLVALTTE